MTRHLFSGDPLSVLRDEALEALKAAIDDLPAASLSDHDAEIDVLVADALPDPVRLDRAGIVFDLDEAAFTSLDLLARPRSREGVSVALEVPFTGDPRFFDLTAAAGLGDEPQGDVDGEGLRLSFVTASTDETTVLEDVNGRLDRIETLLGHQTRTVAGWRPALRLAAVEAIHARRERLAMLERTARALEAAGYRRQAGEPAGRQAPGLEPTGRSGARLRASRASQAS